MANQDPNNLNQLRQLRSFCVAAQTGSFSKAAEKLKLSQPSVSLQIQALEKDLDTLLFERSGPKIRLTPAGELLLDMARPLVDGILRLADSFSARLGDVHAGPLDIASGEATLLYILPDIINAFSAEYPQIDLKLHNVTGQDGMALLRADKVDFAVLRFQTSAYHVQRASTRRKRECHSRRYQPIRAHTSATTLKHVECYRSYIRATWPAIQCGHGSWRLGSD